MGPKSEVKPSLAIAFYVVVKFIYSEKATKFCKIFTLLLTGTTYDKSKVKISQNFMAFSEYMNFKRRTCYLLAPFVKTSNQPTDFCHANGKKIIATRTSDAVK